jgi:hypothetical protein
MAAKTLPREPWRGSQICGDQLSHTTWTSRSSYCGYRKAEGEYFCRVHARRYRLAGDVVRMAAGNARGDQDKPLALLWEPWDTLEPEQPTAEEIAAYAGTDGGE